MMHVDNSYKFPILKAIDKQIEYYINNETFLSGSYSKREVLHELKEMIRAANNEPLIDVIDRWENEDIKCWSRTWGEEYTTNRKAIMATHRNGFFNQSRPGVKTNGEIFIESLKESVKNGI